MVWVSLAPVEISYHLPRFILSLGLWMTSLPYAFCPGRVIHNAPIYILKSTWLGWKLYDPLHLSCCRYWSISSPRLWVPDGSWITFYMAEHPLWLPVHLQSECKQLLPKVTQVCLNPCFLHDAALEMRSVPTETLAGTFLFLWWPFAVSLSLRPLQSSTQNHHFPHALYHRAMCVGYPPSHCVTRVTICPPTPDCSFLEGRG